MKVGDTVLVTSTDYAIFGNYFEIVGVYLDYIVLDNNRVLHVQDVCIVTELWKALV